MSEDENRKAVLEALEIQMRRFGVQARYFIEDLVKQLAMAEAPKNGVGLIQLEQAPECCHGLARLAGWSWGVMGRSLAGACAEHVYHGRLLGITDADRGREI